MVFLLAIRVSCTSTYDPPYESTSGATLIANDSTSDFALLRLAENPQNNLKIIPYYLGWDRTGNPGTGGVGIHHPSGDIKKISLYDMTPQSTSNGSNTVDSTANHWRVIWCRGITEKGSSGSPLINNSRHIIGQLHGGNSRCTALDSADWYGKFSVSWNNSSTNSKRRLSDWLDPNNTGVTVLDGSGCTYYNFTDKNVTTDTPVYACSINVKNVTVSNAKLTLDAERGVNIISNFEVELGAELEIK